MKTPTLLLLSHGLVFAMAFGLAAGSGGESAGRQKEQQRQAARATKTGYRNPLESGGQGERLLKEFLNSEKKAPPDFDSKYQNLKATLPVAKDVRAAAIEELRKLKRPMFFIPTEQGKWDRLAKAEVRLLHWMRLDPVGAMEHLAKEQASALDFDRHVFKDLVAEKGVAASLPWLCKSMWTATTLSDATIAEMKAGGGIGLLEHLHAAMRADPEQAKYLAGISEAKNITLRWGHPFLLQAAEALRFEERDQLMEMVNGQERESDQLDLLRGFARSGPEASAWLLDAVENGELQGTVAQQLKAEAVTRIRESASFDLSQRVAAVAGSSSTTAKSPEDLKAELVAQDMAAVLKDGRDWRYEFHHGDATADEVLTAMRSALPSSAQAGDAALREALFRHLAEEDPERAKILIESLPSERKRAVELGALAGGFEKVSPDIFASYVKGLPAPVTAEETRLRHEGLISKAETYAERFGDSYEQAVKAMPAGADKDAAADGLLRDTRQRNPVEAGKLEEQLSPDES